MKPNMAIVGLLLALLAGCGEKLAKPAKPEPAASTPDGYLKTVVKSQQHAIKTIDTAALNKAIELFYVQEGRFPKELDELVEKKLVPEIPPAPVGKKIFYDVRTGVVTLEKE